MEVFEEDTTAKATSEEEALEINDKVKDADACNPDLYEVPRDSVATLRKGSTYADLLFKNFDSMGYEGRLWSMSYLKERFSTKELELLYKRYEQRSQIGTFTIYLALQAVLSITYIAVSAINCRLQEDECNPLEVPYQLPDLVGHSVLLAICISILLVVYNETIFKDRSWLLYFLSALIAVSIEAIDVGLVVQQSKLRELVPGGDEEANGTTTSTASTASTVDTSTTEATILPRSNFLRTYSGYNPFVTKVPLLSLYNHLVIYLFLPIAKKTVAVAFGFLTSLVCVGLFLGIELTQSDPEDRGQLAAQVLADLVFYASLNFVGFYIRYVGEINMRRGFLDKRSCIETTFKLKYEKEQEENLLLSIIPKHIATKVRESIWTHIEKTKSGDSRRVPFKELFVERHENISILFADICKFTEMTTRLSVDKLVETLNDLFGKFDDAADMNRCMRIKILGDCYYCVSGVPQADPMHAHNCVRMGLQMIDLIADVREEHNVPVNMRIGVHSGYILSGLIGVRKWQFDIWSKDVTIANRMESTGKPGAVHITSATRSHLRDDFDCVKVPTSEVVHDDVLAKAGLSTYLIWPGSLNNFLEPAAPARNADANGLVTEATTTTSAAASEPPAGSTPGAASGPRASLGLTGRPSDAGRRRKSVLMDTSVKNFQKMINSAGEFMKDEIEKLPLRKYDQWLHPEEISPVFLWFRDKSWEGPYLKEHDLLFKFYILASFLILNAMAVILLLTEKHAHVKLWIEYTILFVFLSMLIPCLWVAYIWEQIIDPHYESDSIAIPDHKLLRLFYSAAKKINTSLLIRTVIFFIVATLIVTSAVIDVTTVSCLSESPKNYTYRCALAMMVIFMFLRIHHLLKIFATFCCLSFYGFIILGYNKSDAQNIFSFEYFGFDELMSKESRAASHFTYLAVCALFFILMDRQHEYMRRLDYQWKRQLKSEQVQASATKTVNSVLLQNILPLHVAEHYLTANREADGLYCETYENVAVLFASIPDFMDAFDEEAGLADGVDCLNALNEIIASFDKLLFDEDQFGRVEKIKVISSTYMAACGLQPGRKGSLETTTSRLASDAASATSRERYTRSSSSTGAAGVAEPFSKADNAHTMGQFAAAMMRRMRIINNMNAVSAERTNQFQLRIGFNAGPVIAGVVGANKPLYDIWGDTVNVASRMDYTGVTGKIQVPEATATCLMKERSVGCTFRDVISVKGKGQMKTYFVDLTSDMLIKKMEVAAASATKTPARRESIFHIGSDSDHEKSEDNVVDLRLEAKISTASADSNASNASNVSQPYTVSRFKVTPASSVKPTRKKLAASVSASANLHGTSARSKSRMKKRRSSGATLGAAAGSNFRPRIGSSSSTASSNFGSAISEFVTVEAEMHDGTSRTPLSSEVESSAEATAIGILDGVLHDQDQYNNNDREWEEDVVDRASESANRFPQGGGNSISSSKKDSGYGSQGLLKVVEERINAAIARGEYQEEDLRRVHGEGGEGVGDGGSGDDDEVEDYLASVDKEDLDRFYVRVPRPRQPRGGQSSM